MDIKIKKYYAEIDMLKGIAILFIIFSHSFCEFPVDVRAHLPILQYFSGSFALSLFFCCSGFLFRDDEPWPVFLKKKGLRLIVPLLFFGYLNVFLRLAFSSLTRSQIEGWTIMLYPLTGQFYWFLYSLFLIMFIDKALSKYKYLDLVAGILLLFLYETYLNDISIFTIGRTSYFFIFFVMGRAIRKYYEVVLEYHNKYKYGIPLCFLAFYLFAFIVTYDEFLCNVNPWIADQIRLLIMPISATGFLWSFFIWKKECRILSYFGKYSLQYYLNHMLVLLGAFYVGKYILYLTSSYLIALASIFVVTLAISALMLLVEKRLLKMKFLFGLL